MKNSGVYRPCSLTPPHYSIFLFSSRIVDLSVRPCREVTHTFIEVGPHEVGLGQIVVSTGGTLRMDAPVMVKVRGWLCEFSP